MPTEPLHGHGNPVLLDPLAAHAPAAGFTVPKCKTVCPQRLNLAASAPLSFAMSASLSCDASQGAEMGNHLVRKRPLGRAEMTRFDFIMFVAVCSTALVTVLVRLVG